MILIRLLSGYCRSLAPHACWQDPSDERPSSHTFSSIACFPSTTDPHASESWQPARSLRIGDSIAATCLDTRRTTSVLPLAAYATAVDRSKLHNSDAGANASPPTGIAAELDSLSDADLASAARESVSAAGTGLPPDGGSQGVVASAMELIDGLHDITGLPWWASIPLTAFGEHDL